MKSVATVGAILATVALAGCGVLSQPPTPTQAQTDQGVTSNLGWQCAIASSDSGYVVVATNPTGDPVNIAGFSVVFLNSGQEAGSDTEPGNGLISDPDTNGPTEVIDIDDWVESGGSFTYSVQPDNGTPDATTCFVANWNGGN